MTGTSDPSVYQRRITGVSPATAFVLLLSIGGVSLLGAGWAIQLRHRSPYSGSRMEEPQRKRFSRGAWLAALGSLCILMAQLVMWR